MTLEHDEHGPGGGSSGRAEQRGQDAGRRLLIVDDEEAIRTSLTRVLEAKGYECESAADASTAREMIGAGFFELVLCDIQMPGESGLHLLEQVAAERTDVGILMVTGADDPEIAGRAIELGAYGYVVKPFTPNEIVINVMNALRRLDLERHSTLQAEELEKKLTGRTHALAQAIRRVHQYENDDQVPWRETLDRLTRALALRDEETGRHIERVGLYSELLAEKGGMNSWAPGEIRQASMLHDVGKIGIPDALLTKPGRLSSQEMKTVRRHCELGHELLAGSSSALLDLAASIALTHHERWDGGGYPRGLAGEEIPMEGRIAALADVFDAITSARVYRPAIPMDEALAMMGRESGTGFEPRLIDLFFESLPEFMQIRDDHPDGDLGPTRIRVVVVDDHELFAQGMVRLLDDADGISVAGTARSVAEAIRVTAENEPDVVVLDWRLPDGSGADAARAVLSEHPSLKIVVLTGLAEQSVLAQAIDAGCSVVLTKERAFEDIVGAIHSAYDGEVTIPLARLSSIVGRLRSPRPSVGSDLTARELEVLRLLGEGLSNEAIAESLSLSLHTVRNHVQRIIMKMAAHSKLEAVTKGLREGIIQIHPRFATL